MLSEPIDEVSAFNAAQHPTYGAQMNMDSGLTPAQGRVVFHTERLFRGTAGNGLLAHRRWIAMCKHEALPVKIADMDVFQCRIALILVETACREFRIHLFREIDTQWRSL